MKRGPDILCSKRLLGKAQESMWPECKLCNSVCKFSGQSPSCLPGVSVAVGRSMIRRCCKHFHHFMVLLEGGKMHTHCRWCTNRSVSLVTPSPSDSEQVYPSHIQTWSQKYSPEGITSLRARSMTWHLWNSFTHSVAFGFSLQIGLQAVGKAAQGWLDSLCGHVRRKF